MMGLGECEPSFEHEGEWRGEKKRVRNLIVTCTKLATLLYCGRARESTQEEKD